MNLVSREELLQPENWDKLRQAVYSKAAVGKVGGDPEIFAVTSRTGKVAPAFDFLTMDHDNSLFADGFAAEMNLAPAACLSYVVDSAHNYLSALYTKLTEKKGAKLRISPKSVFEVPQDIMGRATDAQIQLGCAPTFNVYNLLPDLRHPRQQVVRSAGGHIHFDLTNICKDGFATASEEQRKRLETSVRALDMVLGVMSVSMFDGFDDPRRREHYGQAGEYRMPAHGLEYRTLSNAWLLHPTIMHMTFDLARVALRFGFTERLDLIDTTEEEVISIIQKNDVRAARAYMKRNERVLRAIMSNCALGYGGPSKSVFSDANYAFSKYMDGMKTFIRRPVNVWDNWLIPRATGRSWSWHSEGKNCNWGSSQDTLMKGERI